MLQLTWYAQKSIVTISWRWCSWYRMKLQGKNMVQEREMKQWHYFNIFTCLTIRIFLMTVEGRAVRYCTLCVGRKRGKTEKEEGRVRLCCTYFVCFYLAETHEQLACFVFRYVCLKSTKAQLSTTYPPNTSGRNSSIHVLTRLWKH